MKNECIVAEAQKALSKMGKKPSTACEGGVMMMYWKTQSKEERVLILMSQERAESGLSFEEI